MGVPQSQHQPFKVDEIPLRQNTDTLVVIATKMLGSKIGRDSWLHSLRIRTLTFFFPQLPAIKYLTGYSSWQLINLFVEATLTVYTVVGFWAFLTSGCS